MTLKQKTKQFIIILYYLVKHPKRFYNALSARGKKWALRGLITLLIILIAVPVSLWYSAKTAKAAWWNENWMYRKRIDITNGSGSNLTDFQVNFTIDTTDTTKFQATCADIRVTDNTGKLIPYWIEENNPGCGNASTKIWTKVPSLPSSGGTIYVYYGNQSATAAQSGDKTFDFFDDFDAASINSAKWDEVIEGTGGTIETSGGAAVLTPTPNTISSANLRSIQTFTNNVVIETRKKQATSSYYMNFSLGAGSIEDFGGDSINWSNTTLASGYVWKFQGSGASNQGIYRMPATGGNVAVSEGIITSDTSSYKVHKYTYSSSGALDWSIDSVSVRSGTDSNFLSDNKKILISQGEYSGGQGEPQSVDWLFVHKYASSAPTTSLASEEKGPGPVAYWKFDEGQGNTAYNSTSTSNLNGTLATSPANPTWKPKSDCISGKCLYFDGADDKINFTADKGPVSGTGSFSLQAWVRTSTTAESDIIQQRDLDDINGEYIFELYNGKVRYWDYNNAYGFQNFDSASSVNDNKWHDIVFVRSGSNGYIYIDGKLDNSTNGTAINILSARDLAIGFNWRDNNNFYKGYLDEAKIYPYARTADQIKQDYNAGLAGAAVSHGTGASSGNSPKWMTDGLVGHWEMDESSGTVVADSSGNGNNGTLTNAQETGTSDASGNTVTTLVDSDGSLSATDSAYNNLILHFNGACGSIPDGTERTITGYTGASKTFTVATLDSAPNSCAYEVRHQTAGKFGNGVGFDGSNDSINCGHNDILNPGSNSFSIAYWEKISNMPDTWTNIMSKYDWSGGVMYEITKNYFNLRYGSVNYLRSYSTSIVDNNWHHVVFVVDRSDKKIKAYIDGKFDGTNVDIPDSVGSITNASDLIINPGNHGSGEFTGSIDDFRFYKRALSPDEISQLADWAPAPIHDYNFDEKSGTTAHDTGYGAPEGNIDGSLLAGLYGNADSGTTASLLKETDWYFGNDNSGYYDGWNLKATSGAANGNVATITNYNVIDPSNNKEVSFSPNLTGFTSGDTYHVYYNDETGPVWKDGKYGGAVYFDGHDDFVNLGSDFYDMTTRRDQFTLSMWIKPEDTYGYIIYKGGSFSLSFDGGQLRAYIANTFGDAYAVDTATSLTAGNWYHVSVVYNGSKLRIYLNGTLSGETDASGFPYTYTNSNAVLGCANNWNLNGGDDYYYNGYIDDLKLYDYPQAPKQIVEDMNAGHQPPGSPVGSPVAYWKFDEGQGGTAEDWSQNNNDATLQAGGSGTNATATQMWNNNGKFGRAIEFDGTNDYISTANSDATNPQDFTLSAWFKTSTASGHKIIGFENTQTGEGSSSYDRQIYMGTDGKIYFGWYTGATTTVASQSTLNDGQWHHAAAVHTSNNIGYLYIDGVLQGSNTGAAQNYTGYWRLGSYSLASWPNASNGYFTGLIDEAKIYNSALTPDQIKMDMNQGKELVMGGPRSSSGATGQSAEYCVPGDSTSCAGPVGEWKFDEKTGDSVQDTSGNGITGTWSGSGSHWTQGKYGSAGNFDGSGDRVMTDSTNALSMNNQSETVEFWINTQTGFGDYAGTIGFAGDTVPWSVYTVDGNHLYMKMWNDAGTGYDFDTYYITITDNTWIHATYVMSKSGGNMTVSTYMNGRLVGSQTQGVSGNFTNGGIFSIWDPSFGEPGKMDEVRVFNYARTPAQVAWDYNRGKPVGWWKMDECQGSTIQDWAMNGNSGTLNLGAGGQTSAGTCTVNANTAWYNGSSGKFGASLNFDGTDDYVNVTENSGFPIYNQVNYSVAMWVKGAANQTDKRVFSEGSSSSNNPLFNIGTNAAGSGGSLNMYIRNDDGNAPLNAVNSTSTVFDNTWHHIVWTDNNGTAKLYVDGKQDATNFNYTRGTLTLNRTSIGAILRASAGNFFQGQLDDVRAYNYTLTAEQVKQVMNEGSAIRFGG